jgi:hypothetical protein
MRISVLAGKRRRSRVLLIATMILFAIGLAGTLAPGSPRALGLDSPAPIQTEMVPDVADGCLSDGWCLKNDTLTHNAEVVSFSSAPPGFFAQPLSTKFNYVQLYNSTRNGRCLQTPSWLVETCDESNPDYGGPAQMRWTLTAAGNLRLTAQEGTIAENSCLSVNADFDYIVFIDCDKAATYPSAQWDVGTFGTSKPHALVNRATKKCLADLNGKGTEVKCEEARPNAVWWMRTFA